MIAMFRSKFRSRDAAFAAAERLSHLVPGHDCEAWPDRGCWVLVMRYRDDDGHLRCKFVGPEDCLSKKPIILENTRPPVRRQIRQTQARTTPSQQERPVVRNIGHRGDEKARRHRKVYAEAGQQQ